MKSTRLLSFVCLLSSFLLPTFSFSQSPLERSVRFADSRVTALAPAKRLNLESGASWDYANFLFLNSLLALDARLSQTRYLDYVRATAGSFLGADGKTIAKYKPDEHSVDNIAPGRLIETLYKITKDERYLNTIKLLREQINHQKRTAEGGFWHKDRYPHQMWLDGLFMLSPFYADYTANLAPDSEKRAAFDDIAKQIILMDKNAYDEKTGLYYHAWDEAREQSWADKTTGHSPNFWSRAIGWYAMAIVDVLDNFPADHPDRPAILAIFKKLADGVVKWQDPASGCWWQVTDQGSREGNYLEATSSCMFAYALAKAINRGWLPRDPYLAAVTKAYDGINTHLIRQNPDGSLDLTQCCKVAGLGYGRDGTFDYYVHEPIINNDNKGTGPYILAGIELDRLFNKNTPLSAIPPAPDFRYGTKPVPVPAKAAAPKPAATK